MSIIYETFTCANSACGREIMVAGGTGDEVLVICPYCNTPQGKLCDVRAAALKASAIKMRDETARLLGNAKVKITDWFKRK